jgi:D-tyrosyl-tRNA(Tyr) deacylase
VADADFLVEQIKNLRIFEDQEGKMNLSLPATGGEVLVIAQFTLYAGWRKGNRPSFTVVTPLANVHEILQPFHRAAPGCRSLGCDRPLPSQDEGCASQ